MSNKKEEIIVTLSNLAMHNLYIMLNDYKATSKEDIITLNKLYECLHKPVNQFESIGRSLVAGSRVLEQKSGDGKYTVEERESFSKELEENDNAIGSLHSDRTQFSWSNEVLELADRIVNEALSNGKVVGHMPVQAVAELLSEFVEAPLASAK